MLKILRFTAFLALVMISSCTTYELPPGDSAQARVNEDLYNQRVYSNIPPVANYRQGPDYALGLQLQEGYLSVPSAGRCELRFEFYGALDSHPHFVWSTGVVPKPMAGRARQTQAGFEMPFDRQGGVQITLNQSEWQKLLQSRSVSVSFWIPNPISRRLDFYGQQRLNLDTPAGNGNLLAGRVYLPRVCSAGPADRPGYPGYNPYDRYHIDGKFPYERKQSDWWY